MKGFDEGACQADRKREQGALENDVEQGNRRAPRAADIGGANAKSANRTRTKTNQDTLDLERGAVSEAQTGRESDDAVRRKRRQQTTLRRLQVLPKMETGQAIPGPCKKADKERGTRAKALQEDQE